MFDQLAKKTQELGITLEFTDEALSRISQEGFDILYGARPLRRAVQQKIEDKLADQILLGRIKSGECLVCDYRDEFVFARKQQSC